MKIFLSAVEHSDQKQAVINACRSSEKRSLLWNLMSYYYLRSDPTFAEWVRDNSRLVMIDSGAHSFQKGTKVDWEKYTHQYAAFIRSFDRGSVAGYFEMDVDNILGYQEVLRLRSILESESGCPDKIIPVWHKNRGVDDFKRMCAAHAGGVVAVTGFKNEDIRDEQYLMFVEEAWRNNCKIHCLGMTRSSVLDRVPFDFTDSSSWVQQCVYGRVGGKKVNKQYWRHNRAAVFEASYKEAMKMQKHYWLKWRNVCKDEF